MQSIYNCEQTTVQYLPNARLTLRRAMAERIYPSIEYILENWLTPKQAVELRGDITESGIRDLCQRETLLAKHIAGRWYIQPESVMSYIKQHRGTKPKG